MLDERKCDSPCCPVNDVEYTNRQLADVSSFQDDWWVEITCGDDSVDDVGNREIEHQNEAVSIAYSFHLFIPLLKLLQ